MPEQVRRKVLFDLAVVGQYTTRLLMFAIFCGFIGGALGVRVSGQAPDERERQAITETKLTHVEQDLMRLQKELDDARIIISVQGQQISAMQSIGLGAGGMLGLLQAIQILFGRIAKQQAREKDE